LIVIRDTQQKHILRRWSSWGRLLSTVGHLRQCDEL